MPSPQMQEVINRLRQRRATPSSQPPQTYEEILGPYSLADQVNPLPADVSVTDLNADGVPAHWLHIPNAGDGLEQNASVEQFAGVGPTAAHERFELAALLFGEADDVLLVHGDPPRSSLLPTRVHFLSQPCNQTVAED